MYTRPYGGGVRFAALILLVIGLVGCGSDDDLDGGNNISSNNSNSNNSNGTVLDGGTDATDATDAPVADADVDLQDTFEADSGGDADAGGTIDGDAEVDSSDAEGECPQVPCAQAETCQDGVCVADTASAKCGAAEDLGQLALGDTLTIDDSLRNASDLLTTTCGAAEGEEAIFRFSVDETVQVHFSATWHGQFDGVVEFRKDSCEVPASANDPCFDHEQRSFRAEPGHDYYMIVEKSVGRAHDFTIELEVDEAGCVPGTDECTSDTLTRCLSNGNEENYECADECNAAATHCRGDTCEEAIVVTAPATFTGDTAGYHGAYEFYDITACEVDGSSVNTPGQEVVFVLPNLNAGQAVTVDAATNDSNSNAIFITGECGRPDEISCLATTFVDEVLTWTVPADGTYYVFVDRVSSVASTFQYSIDIQ